MGPVRPVPTPSFRSGPSVLLARQLGMTEDGPIAGWQPGERFEGGGSPTARELVCRREALDPGVLSLGLG
jgi:hypothetical protein